MYNGIVKEENPYERLTKRKRSMDLFKKKIELLTKIHDAGIINDSEFGDFKNKLLDL